MNEKIMISVCDKSAAADFNTELSMPDYEPEVRRLLRVTVTPTPPESTFDGARVGMSGELIYEILYCAADGELYSTKATERYEISEALKGYDGAGELVLLCDVTPESLVSRVTAPRKLSLRCRLRGRMRGFCELPLEEKVTYTDDPSTLKRLMGEAECLRLLPSVLAKAEISDELPTKQGGAWRVISHSAAVELEGVEPMRDEAVINGAVCLSLLVCDEEGDSRPTRLERRIQFSETVDAHGLTPACRCSAIGACTSAEFEVSDGSVYCTLGLSLKLNATEEYRAEYVRDMYSTAAHSETVTRSYEHPACGRSFCGNLTASLYEPLEGFGIDAGAEIIDVSASAVVKNIEFDRQKWAIVGEAPLNLIIKRDGEYSSAELKLPFRYETDGDASDAFFTEATATALSARAKSDGIRLSADCELQIVGRICSKGRLEAVSECILGAPIERDDAITVCFTSPTDSVWEVAKRYHTPTENIISKNQTASSTHPTFFII